jgi:hypothetical protein
MTERMKSVLTIACIVAALVAYVWMQRVLAERAELRDQVAYAVQNADEGRQEVAVLEDKLVAARAALRKVERTEHRRGWNDACERMFRRYDGSRAPIYLWGGQRVSRNGTGGPIYLADSTGTYLVEPRDCKSLGW